ncbi:MAG: TonB-dependent receptor [Gammaproteobacteria bacterium]|nr:TonB-dependent receptor [Gammaproteobacteria bacterium]
MKPAFFNFPLLAAVGTLLAVPLSHAQPQIDEIVVTAQKREQTLEEVPISVSVLTEESLDRALVTSTRDLARVTPSLTFRHGFVESASSFAIRGITASSFSGSLQPSVIVVVDDVPLARAGQSIIDLSDIRRVEVLRGPQGTLFGINATGGALNVVTQAPDVELRGYFETTYDENDVDGGWFHRAMVTGPLSDSVRGRLNAMYKDYDEHTENIAPNSTHPGYGKEERSGFAGALEIDAGQTVAFLLKADYADSETARMGGSIEVLRQYYPGFDFTANGQTLTNVGMQNYPGITQLDELRLAANPDLDSVAQQRNTGWTATESSGTSARITWDVNEQITLMSITSMRWFELESHYALDQRPDGLLLNPATGTSLFSLPSSTKPFEKPPHQRSQDTFTQELRLTGSSRSLDYVVGAFYSKFDDEWNTFTPMELRTPTPFGDFSIIGTLGAGWLTDAEFSTWAAFADTTFNVTDRVQIFGGLRYTNEEVDYRHGIWNGAFGFFFGAPGNQSFVGSGDPIADFARLDVLFRGWFNSPETADFDIQSGREDDEITGRIGIGYLLTDQTSVYASYTTGFKGVALNTTPTGTSPELIETEPETTNSFEAGLKGRFLDNRLSVNAAVFFQEVDDSQQGTLISGTPLTQLENVGGLDTRGLELDVQLAATDWLLLVGGLSYVDAEITDFLHLCYDGQTLDTGCNVPVFDDAGTLIAVEQDVSGKQAPHTPELSYRLAARFDIPLANLPFDAFGDISFAWQDDTPLEYTHDPYQVQGSFETLDLSLGIRGKEERYEVSLFVRNATDERWSMSRSSVNTLSWRSNAEMVREAAGRFIGAKARWNFQ